MMPGNPVVGGTVLRRAAIQSPDFVHGHTGWAIGADGTAEFQDVILPGGSTGTPGATVTFAAAAPASPRVGDLWYDTAAGLRVAQWDGTAWVPYQLGAAAVTPGTVLAGAVDGTTVTAATFTGPGGLKVTIDAAGLQLTPPGVPVGGSGGFLDAQSPGEMNLSSGSVSGADTEAGILVLSSGSADGAGTSTIVLNAQAVTLNTTTSASIPVSAAGVTTVAQLITVLKSVAILK